MDERAKANSKINKILAFRNDRFGEFLLNIPAFRALKRFSPEAKMVLVVNPYVKELAERIDVVDKVIVWENRRHSLKEIISFITQVRREGIKLCVIFNPDKEFNIISFLSGIPVRVGYNRKWGFLLTHSIDDLKHLAQKHEVEYNLDLAVKAGAGSDDKNLNLGISSDAVKDILQSLRIESTDRFIAIHPWTSDAVKQWPQDRFIELAKKLTGKYGVKVVIVGGNEERARGVDYDSLSPDNIINVAGKTSLVQLAGLLQQSLILISGDSGPVHLAVCVGTPVIALFRNDMAGKSAKRWGPWGSGNMVIEKKSLNDISVEEVMDKVDLVLRDKG